VGRLNGGKSLSFPTRSKEITEILQARASGDPVVIVVAVVVIIVVVVVVVVVVIIIIIIIIIITGSDRHFSFRHHNETG
jgi:uncharacterized membrane protein YdbT with pleckstrin-like domain